MRQLFLAGTTVGTTWRAELSERLVGRGVLPEQIINPQLPSGVRYTHEHMLAERVFKQDPNTVVLIRICPAAVDPIILDPVAAADKSERLGPISMFEIGKFAYSQPHRTGVVFDFARFRQDKRPHKVLEGLARELHDDFNGAPPYLPTDQVAEDWVVYMLTT